MLTLIIEVAVKVVVLAPVVLVESSLILLTVAAALVLQPWIIRYPA